MRAIVAARKKRWRRVLLGLAIAAIAVLVLSPFLGRALYPVATRWLLTGTRLRAMINAQPQYLLLDWGAAVSEKPGHLTIKNLTIRGSDPNVQWIIRLADADVEFELSALLKRTFRVTTLHGSGLSFFLRNKIKPELVKTTDTSVLPPVPGFPDPPLRSPDDKFPPVDPKAFLIDVRSPSSTSTTSGWTRTTSRARRAWTDRSS